MTPCTSCGRETKTPLLKVVVRKLIQGEVTLRYCPSCWENRALALQAMRERLEMCG